MSGIRNGRQVKWSLGTNIHIFPSPSLVKGQRVDSRFSPAYYYAHIFPVVGSPSSTVCCNSAYFTTSNGPPCTCCHMHQYQVRRIRLRVWSMPKWLNVCVVCRVKGRNAVLYLGLLSELLGYLAYDQHGSGGSPVERVKF